MIASFTINAQKEENARDFYTFEANWGNLLNFCGIKIRKI